jgi:hypothetical protein
VQFEAELTFEGLVTESCTNRKASGVSSDPQEVGGETHVQLTSYRRLARDYEPNQYCRGRHRQAGLNHHDPPHRPPQALNPTQAKPIHHHIKISKHAAIPYVIRLPSRDE